MVGSARTDQRPCRRCPPAEALTVERVRAEVAEQLRYEVDLVDEATLRRRLAACGECPRLATHTCLDCGCYVEFRAALQAKSCPRGRW